MNVGQNLRSGFFIFTEFFHMLPWLSTLVAPRKFDLSKNFSTCGNQKRNDLGICPRNSVRIEEGTMVDDHGKLKQTEVPKKFNVLVSSNSSQIGTKTNIHLVEWYKDGTRNHFVNGKIYWEKFCRCRFICDNLELRLKCFA